MKNIILTLTMMFFTVLVYSQEKQPKVVINQKMIERFNAYEYPKDAVTFNQVINQYSFDETKKILELYKTSNSILTKKEIDAKLNDVKKSKKGI